MRSCALVGRDGSIDWACFPRFDSPSVFAAILDDVRGGRFQIAPVSDYQSTQQYLPSTNVLETSFSTSTGSAALVDFMPPARASEGREAPHELHRLVRGTHGEVDLRLRFQPRFGYARDQATFTLARHGVVAKGATDSMALVSSVPLRVDEHDGATATFTIQEGQDLHFVAVYGLGRTPSVRSLDSEAKLVRTVRFWEATVAKVEYDGLWSEQVMRSFLLLHLLTYHPTGAIVAAPTTSLPERLGANRNWDYRYCWLRDSAWTVGILARMGDPHEAEAFMEWMVANCQMNVDHMQVLYGITPESELQETTLDHLEGYEASAPVRIGNDAAFHRQIDVFGEVVLSMAAFHQYHGHLPRDGWPLVQRMAGLAARMWHLPDRGIWEVRGREQHFVYSKVMCWVALDRAAHLAETYGYDGPVEWWRQQAAKLHQEVLREGWSEKKQAFVQRYGADAIDASALLIPFVGFLPPDDPRVRSTVLRVAQELSEGPFVRRYLPHETDDGLGSEEGAFFILSFWLIGALLFIGEREEALARFDQVMAQTNHLGLMAEMINPKTHRALGNFPQAFSHIGLIHTARNLSQAVASDRAEQELLG